jgi:putative effector of murein hydrolase
MVTSLTDSPTEGTFISIAMMIGTIFYYIFLPLFFC